MWNNYQESESFHQLQYRFKQLPEKEHYSIFIIKVKSSGFFQFIQLRQLLVNILWI